MIIRKNYSLRHLNTFGLDVRAENFVSVQSEREFLEILQLPYRPLFLLGGGSNMLLTSDVSGLVIRNKITGITLEKETDDAVWLSVGGGENWHDLVQWTLNQDFGGLENLSLIPGSVGAAPIQNIGAYGVELQDVFVQLRAVHLDTGKLQTFDRRACRFGYRDSIFKNQLKGQYFISQVTLKLSRKNHILRTTYGAIQQELETAGVSVPTIRDVSEAVIRIRASKLPDPKEMGNSGSFFKNPVLSSSDFNTFISQFPEAVYYQLPDGNYKVPAGWLIEKDGWKGKRVGNTGAHAQQALVLVNYGQATGQEVKALAKNIIASVKQRFGIELTPEVNIIE